MMDYYCTHSINSFRVNEDQLMYTYYFIPPQKVIKEGWLVDTMVPINCGWLLDKLTDIKLLVPKHYDDINSIINEENNVYDFSKVEDDDLRPTFGVDIVDSKFRKWFKDNFEDSDDERWYYKTITDEYGKINKIEIYLKGSIEIITPTKHIISNYASIDYNKRIKLCKDVEKCIMEYPFFCQDVNDHIYFYKLDDNDEYDSFYLAF